MTKLVRSTRMSMLLAVLWFSSGHPATDSAYMITNDYVIVEAEDLPRSANWRFLSVDNYTGSYTGRGYVRWDGPMQSCVALGQPEDQWHNDITGACQGSAADWLRVPVYIQRAGTYIMDLHNLHLLEDGDNDVWTHVVGRAPPIVRVGSHHPGAFGWLSWGPPDFSSWQITQVPAVYTFYVAGRSQGFCVDRIAIYRKTGPNSWPAAAHDLSTPVSTKSPVPTLATKPQQQPASTPAAPACRPVAILDLRGRLIPEPGTGVHLVGTNGSLRTAIHGNP